LIGLSRKKDSSRKEEGGSFLVLLWGVVGAIFCVEVRCVTILNFEGWVFITTPKLDWVEGEVGAGVAGFHLTTPQWEYHIHFIQIRKPPQKIEVSHAGKPMMSTKSHIPEKVRTYIPRPMKRYSFEGILRSLGGGLCLVNTIAPLSVLDGRGGMASL